jgi:hypothetical protein
MYTVKDIEKYSQTDAFVPHMAFEQTNIRKWIIFSSYVISIETLPYLIQ